MPSMIVLTGRRRVDKTGLIKKFLEGETGVYLFVDSEKKSEKMLIAEFSTKLSECFSLGEYVAIENWETLLELIFDLSKQRDMIVCIDEFQRFLQINPSFISQLKKYRDMSGAGSRVYFYKRIECGMINRIFVEQNAPLFKRAQNILFIEPFDLKTISLILNDLGITDAVAKIEMYALFGGIIHYYTLLEDYGYPLQI